MAMRRSKATAQHAVVGRIVLPGWGRCRLEAGCYHNGRLLLVVTEPDSAAPVTTLTVNLPGCALGRFEIFVKDWDLRPAVRAALLDSGLFTDTGRRVEAGRHTSHAWLLARPLRSELLREGFLKEER